MSEIAKCPCCGGPMQKYDDPYASSFLACNSESDECMFVCDIKNFHRIAAAMELAKAEVVASNATWSVPLDRLEAALEASESMLFDAKMRVLEVFGK